MTAPVAPRIVNGAEVRADANGHAGPTPPQSAEQRVRCYRDMLLLRRFEEACYFVYKTDNGKINGFCHLYIGQEAVAVGSIAAIKAQDHVITAYRDHGHGLARGMSPRACMAELFGKVTGSSKGKGGSMHYFDVEKRFWGGHGIVGGQIPLGVGLAFADKYRGDDYVTLAYMGDGAAHQGAVHEAMNLAGLYHLPVIIIIENNEYAMGTHYHRHSAIKDLWTRCSAYDMHGEEFDGMDVDVVRERVAHAVSLARQGKPSLLEANTYRYRGHSMADPEKYRKPGELDTWKGRDPLTLYSDRLKAEGLLDDSRIAQLDAEVKAEVEDALEFAKASPEPGVEEIFTDIYA